MKSIRSKFSNGSFAVPKTLAVAATLMMSVSSYAGIMGDRVFLDVDGDGVQEAGDGGVAGVLMELQTCDGTTIATTLSDSNGAYNFTDVGVGRFRIKVNVPSGYSLSPAGADTWALDSDFDQATGVSSCRSMAATTTRNGIDAGLTRAGGPQPGTAGLGDLIWRDSDGDGVIDPGEPGFAGITIHLATCTGRTLRTMTTGPQGQYAFRNLAPGGYQLRAIVPAGYRPSPLHTSTWDIDSDFDQTGVAFCKSLSRGQYRSGVDLGLVPVNVPKPNTARVGRRVWNDYNANGVFERGEPGVGGVTLRLETCGGAVIGRTVTASNGLYSFNGIAEGRYRVRLEVPAGFAISPYGQPTPPNVDPGETQNSVIPGNWYLDSDFFPATSLSRCTPIADGQIRDSINAGIHRR